MTKILEKNNTKTAVSHAEIRNEGLPFNTKYFDGLNIKQSPLN